MFWLPWRAGEMGHHSAEKSGRLSCSDNFAFGLILVEVTFVCKEFLTDGKETA